MRSGKTRKKDVHTQQRRAFVTRIRESGASYIQIAQMIHASPEWQGRLPRHYTERHVHHDVMMELERLRAQISESAENIRQHELMRLDRLMLAVWQRAIGSGNVPGDMEAMRMVLNIMERRARYIPGLNAPVPIAPTTPDGTQSYAPSAGSEQENSFFHDLAQLFQEFAATHTPPDFNGAAASWNGSGQPHANGTNGAAHDVEDDED